MLRRIFEDHKQCERNCSRGHHDTDRRLSKTVSNMTTTAEGVTMIRTEEWNRGQCDHNLNFMGKEFSKNLETLI